MSVEKAKLLTELRRIKKKILDLENTGINEPETQRGLIDPLFEKLGWEFDSKMWRYQYPIKDFDRKIDMIFFYRGDERKPLLLVEAKALGKNLQNRDTIEQTCKYMVTMGAQWGVLTDGNKYIMYNSDAGHSHKEWNFLTLQIKSADTEDDIEKLADDLIKFIGRESLESDRRQKFYKELVIDRHIENALKSLLSEPFDALTKAIRKECAKTDPNLRVNTQQIISYLKKRKDNEGKIPFTINDVVSNSNNVQPQQKGVGRKKVETSGNKRDKIKDLLDAGLIKAGDIWYFIYKEETTCGRITKDGELEVGGEPYDNPSEAGKAITNKPCSGWDYWGYEDEQGEWQPISVLREDYRKRYKS